MENLTQIMKQFHFKKQSNNQVCSWSIQNSHLGSVIMTDHDFQASLWLIQPNVKCWFEADSFVFFVQLPD
jgi:hypothetical protein